MGNVKTGIVEFINKTRTINAEGFETVTETVSSVMADVKSVSRTEFYAAYSNGLTLDAVFVVHESAYNGQKELKYDGYFYEVLRSYVRADEFVELTARKRNAVPPTP